MSKYFLKLFTVLFIVLAIGCDSTKRAARKAEKEAKNADTVQVDTAIVIVEPAPPVVPDNTPVSNAALVNELLPLWNKEIVYNTFTGKAKMHYEGLGMKHDFTSNIRMKKDEVIWVHVTAGMGLVNVARILITPDSFKLVNYLEKQVMLRGIEDINKIMPAPVNFSMLQNLLAGEVLVKNGKAVSASYVNDLRELNVVYGALNQRAVFNADNTLKALEMKQNEAADGMTGLIRYDDYTMVDGINFSAERVVNVVNGGAPNLLEMNFTSASFNGDVSFPFSIPESYTKK